MTVSVVMELAEAIDFARTTRHAVLVTTRGNGRPQLSNISYAVGDDGQIRISITATRAKYRNLQRDPWAAVHITRPDFYAYAVIEGEVSMTAPPSSPDEPAVDELIELYRAVAGEHPDWDEYRQAMVSDERVVVRLAPTRAYGMLAAS